MIEYNTCQWGALGYAESGVFTIYAVSTGLNCGKNLEQSHIPVDDAAKGQNQSLGSVRKFAVSIPHACGNTSVWRKGNEPCLSLEYHGFTYYTSRISN